MWRMLAVILLKVCHLAVNYVRNIKTVLLPLVSFGCETWPISLVETQNEDGGGHLDRRERSCNRAIVTVVY
jgi:hypothetical protein